jgi:hypothetical protein
MDAWMQLALRLVEALAAGADEIGCLEQARLALP